MFGGLAKSRFLKSVICWISRIKAQKLRNPTAYMNSRKSASTSSHSMSTLSERQDSVKGVSHTADCNDSISDSCITPVFCFRTRHLFSCLAGFFLCGHSTSLCLQQLQGQICSISCQQMSWWGISHVWSKVSGLSGRFILSHQVQKSHVGLYSQTGHWCTAWELWEAHYVSIFMSQGILNKLSCIKAAT